MGCDIHAHIEVKIKGTWHHYAVPSIQRCYAIFEKICGVRGNVENAIAEPRGIPHNVSEVTRIIYADENEFGDCHSETVLIKCEFLELIEFAKSEISSDWTYQNGMRYWVERVFRDDCPDEITDARFICWFDN